MRDLHPISQKMFRSKKIGIVELTDTPQIKANTETLNSLYNIVLREHFDDYENTPLSFEIFSNNLNHGIDPRFNTLWSEEVSAKYPFLAQRDILDDFYVRVKGSETLDGGLYAQWYTWCTNASFQSAYFLHFSGGRNNPLTKVPMRFVQPEAENVFGATFPEYYDDIQQAKPSTHGSPFSHRQIDGD